MGGHVPAESGYQFWPPQTPNPMHMSYIARARSIAQALPPLQRDIKLQ